MNLVGSVALVSGANRGSPRNSNLAVAFRGSTGYVSVTATRAKTRNLQKPMKAMDQMS